MPEPMTVPMRPEPPPCPLKLPKEARDEYQRLAELVTGLKAEDGYSLAMLATCWVTWKRATKEVEKLGNVVMSGGCAIPNPSLGVAARAQNQIMALQKELGIGPIQRKKKRK